MYRFTYIKCTPTHSPKSYHFSPVPAFPHSPSLYPKHIEWATFIDGKSPLVQAHTISTRMLEKAVFERTQLEWMYALAASWSTCLPEAHAYCAVEIGRALRMRLCETEQQAWTKINNMMEEGFQEMKEMARKYLMGPLLEIGWSILLITDPITAPHFAVGFLLAMQSNAYIELTDADIASFVPLVEDQHLSHSPWTQGCPVYAYPNITFGALRQIIQDTFTLPPVQTRHLPKQSEHVKDIKGILHGYALLHPQIVAELRKMAMGVLRTRLECTHWKVGTPTATYYTHVLQPLFPALSESLHANFDEMLAASTIAEQSFSFANSQTDPNNSTSTTRRNMDFSSNFKGAVTRELPTALATSSKAVSDDVPTDDPVPRYRPYRRNDSLHYLMCELSHKAGVLCANFSESIKSTRELIGRGKRKADIEMNNAYAMVEMDGNKRNKHQRVSATKLAGLVQGFATAYLSQSLTLGTTELTDMHVLARKQHWVKDVMQYYLCTRSRYQGDTAKQNVIKVAKKNLKDADPLGSKTLSHLLVEYWTEENMSLLDIGNIDVAQLTRNMLAT